MYVLNLIDLDVWIFQKGAQIIINYPNLIKILQGDT